MKNSINLLDFLNTLSFSVALVSILIGVCASLLLIFGVAQAMKPLLVSITLFLGSFAILCTLRFFHYNRENE
ncbi:MAG: hypothetical protein LBF93_10750 [Zoogloeaceae bacterium]|nr:hypothetical protein [Zoogloeaceae bacterium]